MLNNKKLGLATLLMGLGCSAFATTGGTQSGSAPVFVTGSYGYVGQVESPTGLNTLVYPKVDYNGVAHGNGLFVAVGANGQTLKAVDGGSWQTVSSFQINNINSVRYIGDKFVAVGVNGVVATSSDGNTWDSSLTLGTSYALSDVAGNGNNYILVGGNGLIYAITNGVKARITSPTKNNLSALVYAAGKYIAVGAAGTVVVSENQGSSWNTVASGVDTNLTAIKYFNGSFWAVGANGILLNSTDGVSWQKRVLNPALNLNDLSFDSKSANYVFIGSIGSNAEIVTSADLQAWKYYQGITTTYLFNRVECGNGECEIVGKRGMNLTTSNGGTSWQILKANSTEYSMSAVQDSGNTVVAVGLGGAILTSKDLGLSWKAVSQGYNDYDLLSVKFLNNAFYATGTKGKLMTSADGLNWKTISSGVSGNLNSIAFNAAAAKSQYPWLMVGDNGVALASSDGVTWVNNATNVPKVKLNQVVYSTLAKNFLISGASGNIISTTNLLKNNKYTLGTTQTGNNLRSVVSTSLVYNPKTNASINTVVAVGDNGTITFSPDANGTKFALVNCKLTGPLFSAAAANGVVYISGQLGTLAKISLDSKKNPVCTVINSDTDINLGGIGSGS